jgi:hypothetical protein
MAKDAPAGCSQKGDGSTMNFRRFKRGITSLDVLFLLVVLLGIAGVSAWILRGTYCQGNEMSAIAVLRMISQAEESFHEQNRRYASLKDLTTPAPEGSPPLRSSLPPQIAKDTPFEATFSRFFSPNQGQFPLCLRIGARMPGRSVTG